jgi:transposase-like protein
MNKYSISEFHKEFPDEDACLKEMFERRFGNLGACPKCKKQSNFYKIRDRKCYACQFCGYQLHPLADTIFHKSATPLKLWFYAIYLFSTSRNGVSAKELQRQLGVTYKTAWRMASQIRALMTGNDDMLNGTVEVDETYIGGYKKGAMGGKGKTPVLGMVERGGKIKTKTLQARETHLILNEIRSNVARGASLITDKFGVYRKTKNMGYSHSSVNHWKREYVRGKVHTNTIEGFWGNMKRAMDGTYHVVSPKHLQSYVNEFSFRYNHRKSATPLFLSLLSRAWTLAG